MYKLAFCYPSRDKENKGIEMLYSPLSLAYLASHTPDYYKINLYDEYVGEAMDPETVDVDLVAVSSLLQEFTREKKSLKVIKQEGFSILLEEGEKVLVAIITIKELKVIRQKLQEFLEEFQNFFGELIDKGIAETTVFLPAKRLAEKHFS